MATYVTPKRATAFQCFVELRSQADTKLFQVNPTLAAGDVKVSKDGGAFANVTTLPVVTPSGGRSVQVDLSATEMTADNVKVVFSDAAGAEWCDLSILIQTTAQQIDDLATPTNITAGTITTVTNLTNAPTAGDLTATMKSSIAASAVASVTGAVGSVATGGISAASFAAGAIDAAAIAADAIGASELAADAVAEIQAGLSTLDAAAVATATQTGLTAQGYTTTRAGYLDTLNGLVAAIWAAATSGLTTVGSIGKLVVDYLDAAVSSRLASASYTAAPSAATVASQVRTELTTELGRVDVAVSTRLASASYTAPLDAAGVRTAVGLASANLDTQLDALPTNAELATALGTADDAVLAAIAALNNLSSAGAQAAASAALTAYGAALQSTSTAIKTKTDNLTFTSGTDLDVNVQKVNDVALTGVGTSGDPWGPA